MGGLRVVLVEDHAFMREALRQRLSAEADLAVVGEASDGRSASLLLRQQPADVVVVDLSLPDVSGVALIRELSAHRPRPKLLMLTLHQSRPFVAQAMQAGADGYALKVDSGDEIVRAIRTVAAGNRYYSPSLPGAEKLEEDRNWRKKWLGPLTVLSCREREVFDLIIAGRSNPEIAGQLFVSVKTVETHRTNLMRKLGMHNLAQLMRFAAIQGLLRD